jgi:hypothetical protein
MEGGFAHMLLAKGVRKEKRMRWVIDAVQDQPSFDDLFRLLFHHEKSLILRAVEAVEKITAKNPEYLRPHKAQVIALLTSGDHKELKSHMVKLLPRLDFTAAELPSVWNTISYWAKNPNENKTIRAGALQVLYELSKNDPVQIKDLHNTLHDVGREPIPSIQAKIRKLKRQAGKFPAL